jgi:signal transduction histidine kinase
MLQLLGLAVALFVIARLKDFDRLRVAGLLATLWIVACSMIVVIALKDLSPFAEALICLQLGAALLIPWGLVVQAFAGVAAVLAYLVAIAVPGRNDVGDLADMMWICFGGALALSVTYLLEQARRAMFYQHLREREVISSFAHDIRAPASAISMQTDLVNEISQDAGIRSRMRAIQASATQVLNLAQNMVDSIRIEEGEIDLRPELMDLNRLVSDTVSEQESLARVRRIDVAQDLYSGLPLITADPLQLKRVIINLLSNALNVTSVGGRVVLSTSTASDWVKMSVKDSGAGISLAERDQLFVRYSDLARRSRSGTGLGLFIVKDIVERSGGRVEVESTPGEGSTFSVLLPCRAQEEKPATPSS